MHIIKNETITFDLSKEDDIHSYYERINLHKEIHEDQGIKVSVLATKGTEVKVLIEVGVDE
ncbi:hypothetical protein BK744_03220 [Bacillus thuringiensis serovar zhaodongensis]|uniref:hypothetical protein n=1 Tax=Bacillus thuringiensis TaxID=1428 RepID=UPI000A393991|nr:hypothetical protein [Bacillus thuringiensis]OUB79478.1 hypothetical protein BK744_03220 [Bacillus thuringiensis serovar zhaodongensis]